MNEGSAEIYNKEILNYNRKALGFGELVKQRERQLLCEICQTKFVCEGNNQNNCWCMKVENKTIDLNLKDCICRLCLSKLAKYTQKDEL